MYKDNWIRRDFIYKKIFYIYPSAQKEGDVLNLFSDFVKFSEFIRGRYLWFYNSYKN